MSRLTIEVLDGIDVAGSRLVEICGRYGIAELAVFGSVARGEARADSDVDLLYVMVPGRALGFDLNRLEDELVELFRRPVDLVAKGALHELLRDRVLAEARTLYAAWRDRARRDCVGCRAHHRADLGADAR